MPKAFLKASGNAKGSRFCKSLSLEGQSHAEGTRGSGRLAPKDIEFESAQQIFSLSDTGREISDTSALSVPSRGEKQMTGTWEQWEGQVVNGKVKLGQCLSSSSQGAVFLAELENGEPPRAAIKLIAVPSEEAETQLAHWHLTEGFSHPHLIRLFQTGRHRFGDIEALYAVMEYAPEDLSQILPHRSLTAIETREMLRPVLDVLGYLHGKGLVHGHIKPANIMAIDDQLKVSSDGLGPAGEPNAKGRLPSIYDAPETAHGGRSPSGDIWSLGMTLTEVLTQHLPVWELNQREDPIVPETLPAPFLDIARNCLCLDPKLRWNIADIKAHLQPASPAPGTQKNADAAHAARKSAPGKRRYTIPAAAIVLAVAGLLAAPKLFNKHTGTQATSAASEQPEVRPRPDRQAGSLGTKQPTEDSANAGDKRLSSGRADASFASAKTETGGQTDDLVQGGVAQQVLPNVPQSARDTIRGTVRVAVKVQVDPSGNVAEAILDSPGPSKYFANLAVNAARRWKFIPAKPGGRNVPNAWILRFEFTQTATKAIPKATP